MMMTFIAMTRERIESERSSNNFGAGTGSSTALFDVGSVLFRGSGRASERGRFAETIARCAARARVNKQYGRTVIHY